MIYDKHMKRILRRCAERRRPVDDPLEQSMREEWRRQASKDGESLIEYRIFQDDGWTDSEITEWLDGELRIIINSPYDCTGRIFTQALHWRRVPCGIAVAHRMMRDV